MDFHPQYMQRALQLAALGLGKTRPNPMVGCVIVHEGRIIAEGYHHQYGGPHAEVVAVSRVEHQEKLKEADVYVTLEPCSHHGKTPPCANLLINKRVKRVFIASGDPNPEVNGQGVKRMRDAGIEVHENLLSDEAEELNKRFFTFHRKKRPYLVLKWAQTADGFVARENYDSKWISNELSRQRVHRYRAEEQGILVGYNTVKFDDPTLNTRDWCGLSPTRIIIDPTSKLPNEKKVFDGSIPTLIMTDNESRQSNVSHWIDIGGAKNPRKVIRKLYQLNIQSVLIEGGPSTLESFISAGLWDEIHVFQSETRFGSGISAPEFQGTIQQELEIGTDKLKIYRK